MEREPREIPTILEFSVERPMKKGRRKSSGWGPSRIGGVGWWEVDGRTGERVGREDRAVVCQSVDSVDRIVQK